jgi:membrane protein
MWQLIVQTFQDFIDDECPRMAAALAYYLFFALPAILVAIVFAGGLLVGQQAVSERLQSHLEETVGRAGAEQMTLILKNASQPSQSRTGWLVGAVMLVVGATGALQELQTAVNRAWRVEPDPNESFLRSMFVKRLVSLALLVAIAVILLVSVAVSWGLAAFGQWIDAYAADWLSSRLMGWLHTLVSLAIYTLLFATLLRFLPDAKIAWSDVWIGAVATALLFWLGQSALSAYFSWSRPTSAYGAAGSLALVLLWMYYSALIFFLGVEFTQVLVRRRGRSVVPERGARAGQTPRRPRPACGSEPSQGMSRDVPGTGLPTQ